MPAHAQRVGADGASRSGVRGGVRHALRARVTHAVDRRNAAYVHVSLKRRLSES
jgi:hypothetical protein